MLLSLQFSNKNPGDSDFLVRLWGGSRGLQQAFAVDSSSDWVSPLQAACSRDATVNPHRRNDSVPKQSPGNGNEGDSALCQGVPERFVRPGLYFPARASGIENGNSGSASCLCEGCRATRESNLTQRGEMIGLWNQDLQNPLTDSLVPPLG